MTASAAILLAAGEGRRMGMPKALLVVDGKPLVRAHAERFREAGCSRVIVVVREADAEAVRGLLGGVSEARLVATNSASMAESLAAGLRQLGSRSDAAIVISPVDVLPARVSTLIALLDAVMLPGVQVATPRYLGRNGHPIVARSTLLAAFHRGYSGTLRALIHSADAQRRHVETEDSAILGDFDTPEEFAAARAWGGERCQSTSSSSSSPLAVGSLTSSNCALDARLSKPRAVD